MSHRTLFNAGLLAQLTLQSRTNASAVVCNKSSITLFYLHVQLQVTWLWPDLDANALIQSMLPLIYSAVLSKCTCHFFSLQQQHSSSTLMLPLILVPLSRCNRITAHPPTVTSYAYPLCPPYCTGCMCILILVFPVITYKQKLQFIDVNSLPLSTLCW